MSFALHAEHMHLLPNITDKLLPGGKLTNYFSLRHFPTAFFKMTAAAISTRLQGVTSQNTNFQGQSTIISVHFNPTSKYNRHVKLTEKYFILESHKIKA
jgi:hypothetical protein